MDFKLPVTIRLRNSNSPSNPSQATVDLGSSLGQREIDLGGSLAAEIDFSDSYHGGALGNVGVRILPSATKSLVTTSVPLLWNTQVTDPTTNYYGGLDAPGQPGCGDYRNANVVNGSLPFAYPYPAPPYWVGPGPTGLAGYLPSVPGVDDPTNLQASKVPGDDRNLGGNPQPFPYSAQSVPGGMSQPPSPQDTVLRTQPLRLSVATPGTEVDQTSAPGGPSGASHIVIGASGGEANIFGNVPGKSYGLDVTISFATRINSILRDVEPDLQYLIANAPWPADTVDCRQLWTGYVRNYIIGVHVAGNFKIGPGISPEGHLRLGKATLSSFPNRPTQVALAACLQPYSIYAQQRNDSDTAPTHVPPPTPGGPALNSDSVLPWDSSQARPAPDVPCNAPPVRLLADMGLGPLQPASSTDGYTTSADGSTVTVSGSIGVNNVSADVLVGDV